MKNALRVLKRDYLRLLKAPAALTVVFVLVVLPSLYTWFNVVGFWDPYGNTGNIRVCVVNEDEGATMDGMGDLDLGGQVVDQLQTNDQLGWTFTDKDTAMEEVNSGKAYAAFVIPSDFSYDVTTFLTGDFTQPKLEYYVNEKAGGVSTKVTDTGANTLDETINSTFVSTVSGVVADVVNQSVGQAQSDLDGAKTSIGVQLDKANASLADARNAVADLSSASNDLSSKANDAKDRLQNAKNDISNLSTQLTEASQLLTETQNSLSPFVTQMTGVLDKSSQLSSQAASNATAAVGQVNGSVQGAEGTVNAAVEQGNAVVSMNEAAIKSLKDLAETPGIDESVSQSLLSTANSLETQNNNLKNAISGASDSYTKLQAASNDINSATDKVNSAFQNTLKNTDSYRGSLTSETLPALNDGTTKLSNSLAGLSTAVSNQALLVDQSMTALDQLNSALQTTATALGQTDGVLSGFQSDIDTVKTDLLALGTAGALGDLFGKDGLDASKIADFMLSPTQLQTVELYSVNAYGSAMAPLFMNMTLWIGVFMLLVILRQEVDDEGIPNLSSRERYLGKWLFLAPLVSLQAIVRCGRQPLLGRGSGERVAVLPDGGVRLPYLSVHPVRAVGAVPAHWQGLVHHPYLCADSWRYRLVSHRDDTRFLPGGVSNVPVHVWHQRPARNHCGLLRIPVGCGNGHAAAVLPRVLRGWFLGASVPNECESDVQQADCRNRHPERRGVRAAGAPLSYGSAVPRPCRQDGIPKRTCPECQALHASVPEAAKGRRDFWFGGSRHRHAHSFGAGLRESDRAYLLVGMVGSHHPCSSL